MDDDIKPNILFIMCDQLRWDYLSCYGHPSIETPNIDQLANNGVRFTQAYCQAPLCGPSRASFYTGRYMSSHGAMCNDDPLKLGELTLRDYLGDLGYRTALVGKAHTSVSAAGQSRMGLTDDTDLAKRLACGGFEPYEVHEGLYPEQIVPPDVGYNNYLQSVGYSESNGWQSLANNAKDSDGNSLNGWLLRNSPYPAQIPQEHSETAFITNRAMDFISEARGGSPWCLHLSYIKPHWPIVAPSPYHNMYSAKNVLPAIRSEREKHNPHPVVNAFAAEEYSLNYAKNEVRKTVIPVYMGLIKQIDDNLGRLFNYLKDAGIWNNTLIVLTSDHGDYLGDHWLGEKDLFHDCSAKIPLIIHNPRAISNGSRGRIENALVESIDLLPTFVEYAGGTPCFERLEGYSLLRYFCDDAPGQADSAPTDREYVVSEIDYSDRGPRTRLNLAPYFCRAYMLKSSLWKYIFYEGFRPQLFDLTEDPNELNDLGESPEHTEVIQQMELSLFTWLRQRKHRTEQPYSKLNAMGPELDESYGIIIGRW